MKKYEWINGNKMKFESGFATFDKQTNYISKGAVISNTQYSNYIRGNEFRDYDLKFFYNLPNFIRNIINQINYQTILYEFSHTSYHEDYYTGKSKHKIIDGYVLTTTDGHLISKWVLGKTIKSELAVNEAVKYICE